MENFIQIWASVFISTQYVDFEISLSPRKASFQFLLINQNAETVQPQQSKCDIRGQEEKDLAWNKLQREKLSFQLASELYPTATRWPQGEKPPKVSFFNKTPATNSFFFISIDVFTLLWNFRVWLSISSSTTKIPVLFHHLKNPSFFLLIPSLTSGNCLSFIVLAKSRNFCCCCYLPEGIYFLL